MNRISAMKYFGRTVPLLCVLSMAALAANAQTFEVVASLPSNFGDYPSSLIQGTDGNLYGMTAAYFGGGRIFEYTLDGQLTGSLPGGGSVSPPVLGTDGNVYGMVDGGDYFAGSIFRVSQAGKLTVLHKFVGKDGEFPDGMLQAVNGNFYGTTADGGTSQNCIGGGFIGCGTVFELTPAGKLTTLHSFNSGDGAGPSGLVQDSNGIFYGTTGSGGAYICYDNIGSLGCGTIFQITPSGKLTTLYDFCSHYPQCPDGFFPTGPLVQGPDGSFYGTTTENSGSSLCPPSNTACGTVFNITGSGKLTTLYTFCAQANCLDGSEPSPIVLATDGNFYGTTAGGGTTHSNCDGCGTIFQITPAGKLTTLYRFCDQTDCAGASFPSAALVQDTNGNFYGGTAGGGSYGNGIIFSFSMGLPPFVKTVPIAGKTGQKVIILGNNLIGATGVTFNGVEAEFDVVSATEILAMVPSGASTGIVQVVTPSGTLSSNVVFRLL